MNYAPKEVFAPHLDRNVKLGRRPPRLGAPMLRLGAYLKVADFGPQPSARDWSAPALPVLHDVELNDQLGDCVIAAVAHVLAVLTGNAGALFTMTKDEIIAMYEAIGGYNPADPSTDQGCNMQDMLNYLVKVGTPNGTKAKAWLAVDPTNDYEVQAAVNLFGNVFYGLGLPDAWVQNMPSHDGFTWDIQGNADLSNGHCIMQYGYDASGNDLIDTWGLLGNLKSAARKKYMAANVGGEAYTILDHDWIIGSSASAPNGVAWQDLESDWNKLFGGSVVVTIPPAPVPSPIVPPSSSPTKDQVRAWLLAALQASHGGIFTRSQIVTIIDQGLGSWS